ncbi:MAG: winged helix-turn-helix transcriptional regulator [Thermoplasmata archaeon]|nr:MAG: winged helix-turn-helix transcriptional regulator [Thermoplasmata archaeon]
MKPGGRELREKKNSGRWLGIPTLCLVWFLVAFLLLIASLAVAAPKITSGDCGGYWSDSFQDEKGIETYQNLRIEEGQVALPPEEDEANWEKKGVAVENGGPYDYFFANIPSVLKENDLYRMWYAGANGLRLSILYASSADGINWEKRDEPLSSPGNPGDPDFRGSTAPRVIKDDGSYKMWYVGNDSVNEWAMYATSPDGITWTKGVVVFEETGVRPNIVMKDGAIYKMWYTYLVDGHWRVFYATSPDGESWTKHGLVLDIGAPGELDDMHVGGVCILKGNDGSYQMWYSGHDETTGYRIFYATSPDGVEWTKQGMIIDKSPGEQDQINAGYPCVLKDDCGYYKMWYNGNDGNDSCVMYAVKPPTFMDNGNLVSKEISLSQVQRWEELVIEKTEDGIDNHVLVSVLDGRTCKIIEGFEYMEEAVMDLSSIDNKILPSIRLMATFIGDGSSTPVLNEWKVTWLNDDSLIIDSLDETKGYGLWNAAIPTAIVGIILFSVTFAGSTEVGKYRLIPIISPLYSRLKRKEVLELFTRERIYDYINGHPGDHYNSIKKKLDLNNGSLAYHLRTLEEQNFIKSMRDGMYKRFYPVNMKIPRINGFTLASTPGRIMKMIFGHPGMTQKDVVAAMGVSQQVVSYHINQLIDSGLLRAERHGKTFRYFAVELY